MGPCWRSEEQARSSAGPHSKLRAKTATLRCRKVCADFRRVGGYIQRFRNVPPHNPHLKSIMFLCKSLQ